MRQAAAVALTLALVVGALVLSRRPRGEQTAPSPRAEEPASPMVSAEEGDPAADAKQVIWDMVEATGRADVNAYLNCFGGDLRARMEDTIKEKGREAFVQTLRRNDEQTMGVAILGAESIDRNCYRIQVDLVFRDGHQEQTYEVRRRGGKWVIVAIRGGPRKKSAMPYGAEVGPLVLPSPTPTGVSGETGLAP